MGIKICKFGYDKMKIYTDDRFNKDLVDIMFSLDTTYKDQMTIAENVST